MLAGWSRTTHWLPRCLLAPMCNHGLQGSQFVYGNIIKPFFEMHLARITLEEDAQVAVSLPCAVGSGSLLLSLPHEWSSVCSTQ